MTDSSGIDIVLNTSYRKGTTPAPRLRGIERSEFIPKCFTSLVRSIAACKQETSLFIVDDHSGEEWLDQMRRTLMVYGISRYKVVPLEDTGPSAGLITKSLIAKTECQGLVYMVEDDYLHAPDAVQSMWDAYHHFRGLTDLNPVAIYPFDSPGLYLPDRLGPTRLFRLGDRYWRGTTCASSTIFLHSEIVRAYWPIWEAIALSPGRDPSITEDNTINRLFNNTVTAAGPVCLFSPVPSLAIHLAGHEPMQMTTVMNDWKSFYDGIIS